MSEWLKHLREQAGLTQEELAARLGTHNVWVSRRESADKTQFNLDEVAEWAEACGHVFDWSFRRPGETPTLSGHQPDTVEMAETFMDAWERMDPSARRMIRSVLLVALEEP